MAAASSPAFGEFWADQLLELGPGNGGGRRVGLGAARRRPAGRVSAEVLLAIVAVINSLAAAIALIIHALRVPYRQSDREEQSHVLAENLKLRASYPPPPPIPGDQVLSQER